MKVNKKIIVLLPILFISLLLLVYVYAAKKISPPAIFIPDSKVTPLPTEIVPSPTSEPTRGILEIENDLSSILQDIQKVKKEDKRLIPPDFIFKLGF